MSIPETQLETWAKQGSKVQSAETYAKIKSVLWDEYSPYATRDFTSFLQGSYGNDTNVWRDSDVDVVIQLKSSFHHDLESLDQADKDAFAKAHSNATYGLTDFKKAVADWLIEKYGKAVNVGAKAIFIAGDNSRRDADVLPATTFRRYRKFKGLNDQDFVEGICFFAKDGTRIENFPKQHSDNCTSKHQSTKSMFKPMVRILKNMRNRMIEKSLIKDGLAPSYYLEGLWYNVPVDKFGARYDTSFTDGLNWILQADRSKFVCANQQYYLLREGSPVTWRDADCTKFLNAVIEFWNQGDSN